MRSSHRYVLLSALLGACSSRAPAPTTGETSVVASPPAVAASVESAPFARILSEAMPGIVLLLNTHADGTVTYGAGFLVSSGVVLTSEHVVASAQKLGAMLYKPGRTSYTPMDGGLSRFLFENQGDILEAHEIGGDATSDLAVLRLGIETSAAASLPMAKGDILPGERIIALGHPQELVWSFTQGMVGTIQQGAIQHDAAISFGSSGGPLLNLRGEVVGINIAKVVSESSGLSFARPIALAGRYLDADAFPSASLDQSSPEAAALSCWRAQEIGRVETGDCFDWDASYAAFRTVLDEAMNIAPPLVKERLSAEMGADDFRTRWIAEGKRHQVGYFVEGLTAPPPAPPLAIEAPALARAKADALREEERVLRDHPDLQGVYADRRKPALLQARLRLGIRADRTVNVESDRAWVELAGRNHDGTVYRFSEFYVKIGARWVQRIPPLPADVDALPPSFAPPLCTFTNFRAQKLEKLLRDPSSLRAKHPVAPIIPLQVVKKAAPGTCTAALCAGKRVGSS